MTSDQPLSRERLDLLDSLRKHRELFLTTVQGLSDEQARERPTVSELSLGGLVKHVTHTVAEWNSFVTDGASEQPEIDWATIDWTNPPAQVLEFQAQFVMGADETLAGLVAAYAAVADRTEELVAQVPDLDADHLLPEAPWFVPGTRWSARRVFVHVIAEMTQHSGHADIIRESLDGQKTMG